MGKLLFTSIYVFLVACGAPTGSDPYTEEVVPPAENTDGTPPPPPVGGAVDAGEADGGMDATMDMVDAGPVAMTDASEPEKDSGEPDKKDSSKPDFDCTPSKTRCDDLKAQTCSDDGEWETDETCPFVCTAGICSGSCTPGSKQCDALEAQTCDATGNWQTDQTCPFVCSTGSCTGSCSPGTKQCDSLDAQTCDGSGAWQTDQTCPFVCSTGSCEGVCIPGSKKCDGLDSQTCNASGQWTTDTTCPFLCSGEGVCSGSCVPASKQCDLLTPQTCSGVGTWVDGSACPYACSAGSCTGVCVPGTKQCDSLDTQTCDANGVWQTAETCSFICSSGSCSGSCTPGAKKCTGDTPQTCDGTGTWQDETTCQFVCSAGSCTGVCDPGDTQCADDDIQTCNASGQWAAAVACGAVAGAASYCDSGTCTFECNLDFDDCDGEADNGCEANLNSDGMNCGSCGHDCCGGSCSSGTCQAHDFGFSSQWSFDVGPDNIYWIQGWDIMQTPRFGGGTTPLREDEDVPKAIVVTGNQIVWTTAGMSPVFGSVYSIPIGGGSVTTESLGGQNQYVLYNGVDVFWTNVMQTRIEWASLTTTDEGVTYLSPKPLASVVADDTYVYSVASGKDNPILRTPVHGGSSETFEEFTRVASESIQYYSLTNDDTNLYFLFQHLGGYPADCGLWKKPLAGGTPTQLVPFCTWHLPIETDGQYVYYFDNQSGNVKLMKVSVNGGTPIELAANTQGPNTQPATQRTFKVYDECAYWSGGTGLQAIATTP